MSSHQFELKTHTRCIWTPLITSVNQFCWGTSSSTTGENCVKWLWSVIKRLFQPGVIIMEVTTNAKCFRKVKLITWNGQVAYWSCKSAASIFIHSALCETIVWKCTKISCQSFLNTFAENYSSGIAHWCNWVSVFHVFTHKCPGLFVFQESACIWMMCGGPEGAKRRIKEQKKAREKKVLTVCCHPAWCLLSCVCMVLTSSIEKFCQVWAALTFSLSEHVYSSPIPIKISTPSLPVSLPPAQTCITF